MADVASGERWGYRARGIDPLVEVEVLRHGANKPARVLIRFVDESFEGREEWVTPARLKVLWEGAAEFEAREARWERVDTHPGLRDEPTEYALDEALRLIIDPALATGAYRRPGVLEIHDVPGLAAYLDLEESQLRAAPESFEEDGDLIVPWATTEVAVRRACALYPNAVLREVEKQEREARHEAAHGRWYGNSRGTGEFFVTSEDVAARDEEWAFQRPTRDLLRAWCGTDAVARHDELKALREEVMRLDRLMSEAILTLRSAGHVAKADDLERRFGVPAQEARESRR